MNDYRLVIIGAGLAGLTAAIDLVDDPGWTADDIIVVEREAAIGGRLATEIIDGAVFDLGAQFFTARSSTFQDRIEGWLAEGLVQEWCRGFAQVDGYPRYRAVGGMQSLAAHLGDRLRTAGVHIATAVRAGVTPSGHGRWTVSVSDTTIGAASVLVTAPVPEARELLLAGEVPLGPEVTAAINAFDCHRVLALLAVVDGPPSLAPSGALQQPDDPVFSFVADNQAKGISPVPCVTFHTSHGRSAELWDRSDDEVLAALTPAAESVVAPARIVGLRLRRWRCAGPVAPFPEPCLVAATEPGLLVLAGDGFGGSKVEGAFLSGLAAATSLREGVSRTAGTGAAARRSLPSRPTRRR